MLKEINFKMKKYLTELHLHTKESSVCSRIPAKEMLEAYQKEGYSTIIKK